MKKDIRFLLTQRCNYDCYFCHSEGIEQCSGRQELTIDEYVSLYTMHSRIECWNGVTLSGGEPLLYKDILSLVKSLHSKGAIITLVTNGYLLLENMDVLRHIDRINVSIHTVREDIYESIVRRRNVFHKVLQGLRMAREIYPELKIRLNVTPTKDMNWSEEMLSELIEFAKMIDASIKFTELFPKSDENCVALEDMRQALEDMRQALVKLGYTELPSSDRNRDFEKESHHIFLTQCTCSRASETPDPVGFCRESHDLYVNHTGHFMLCRLGNENIEFLEDLREGNYAMVEMKIQVARRRISSQVCKRYLKVQ